MNEPFVRWAWIADHTDDIRVQLLEHIQLTAIAIVIGLAISIPLGVLSFRYRRLFFPTTAVTGILYTIPSLALFAFLQAYTGLSFTTAEIGLVGYTLLILIRNVVVGLNGVSEDVKEAARGMGYSPRQLLWRVELPLALPVIVAGVRIATVTTIGLVTVTSFIGLGGMGHFILTGFRLQFPTMMLLGAVGSLVLALAADGLLLLGEKLLTPWSRARVRTV